MTKVLQLLASGLVLGSIYSLVALGFTIVYKATKVVNFAHGAVMGVGAYTTYELSVERSLPWPLAVAIACVVCALVSIGIQKSMIKRMLGRGLFSAVMVTFGFDIMLRMLITLLWKGESRPIGDPWGSSTWAIGSVTVPVGATWGLLISALCMIGVYFFFERTRSGLFMLGTASDQEAALLCGVDVRRVFTIAWAVAGVLAAIAGVYATMFPRSLSPSVELLGLQAFPAAILGGLDSPAGAVVGGFSIGLLSVYLSGYASSFPFLGPTFADVAGYLLMIGVLLVRPYGLFGTKEVVRA